MRVWVLVPHDGFAHYNLAELKVQTTPPTAEDFMLYEPRFLEVLEKEVDA